jgi:hypothetical protein
MCLLEHFYLFWFFLLIRNKSLEYEKRAVLMHIIMEEW